MKTSWATRLGIGCMLMACALAYNLLITPEDNWPMYYASAAFMDANIVLALRLFGNNQLVYDLQNINFTAIVVHASGFVMYMRYMPPTSYNAMLYTLIILQWLRLLWVGPNERNTVDNFRLDMVLNRYRLCR